MSESKHTSGPWKVEKKIRKDPLASSLTTMFVYALNGLAIFHIGLGYNSHSEDMANASLIEAAPELLEALEAICNSINLPPGLEKKATEAIRKAKGADNENS